MGNRRRGHGGADRNETQVTLPKNGEFDALELWRALELDHLLAETWQTVTTSDTPSDEADAALWLAPDEKANLELEVAFLETLEADPRFHVLASGAWRRAYETEAREFASTFCTMDDPNLADWVDENEGDRERIARAAVESEYARTHEVARGWLKWFRGSDEYAELVREHMATDGIARYRAGDLTPQLADNYRHMMDGRARTLVEQAQEAVKSARRARKTLDLHRQLVDAYPVGCDPVETSLGGRQAYTAKLIQELADGVAKNEFLLNTHGRVGFSRISDTSPEAIQRALEDRDIWRRSIERSLRRGSGGKRKRHGDEFPERIYLDLLAADNRLAHLAKSQIAATVRDYVMDQLLAQVAESILRELCEAFGRDAFIAAMRGSTVPELVMRRMAFEEYAATDLALQETIKRAYAQAAVSASADPYLAYPSWRERPRSVVIHVGPTNSGKTHDGIEAFRAAGSGVYLGPLRLLAAEVADASNEAGVPCSLLTGEERRTVEGATHTACTVEMFDPTLPWEVAVIDEAQMIGDLDRGGAWSRALIGLDADVIHVCCAPEGLGIVKRVLKGCQERFGDTYRTVKHHRLNKLVPQERVVRFPEDIQEGDAVIVFSKKDVHAAAAELVKAGLSTCIVYGALPHTVRRDEAKRFRDGDAQVVVATDAIGMGLNLPVRRIVFLKHDKYDGHEKRELTVGEVKQIAGRAGRYGFAESGIVASATDPALIAWKLEQAPERIEAATLAFPRDLLQIDAPVSVLFDAWSNTEAPEPFRCADYSEEAALALRAQAITDDTTLIYQFAMLPFKSRDERVLDLWEALLRAHVAGEPVPDFDKGWDGDDLDSMQVVYDMLDLMYSYLMGPGSGKEVDPDDVAELRDLVSKDISVFLGKQSYASKKCAKCGKPLPWSHSFGVCDECYRRQGGSFHRRPRGNFHSQEASGYHKPRRRHRGGE